VPDFSDHAMRPISNHDPQAQDPSVCTVLYELHLPTTVYTQPSRQTIISLNDFAGFSSERPLQPRPQAHPRPPQRPPLRRRPRLPRTISSISSI